MTNRLFLDVHILQTVPPANINRDDNGSPKSAIYGGVRRSRASSQAWKRAARKHFVEAEQLTHEERAVRTARISSLLARRLTERCHLESDVATRLATALLAPLKIKAAQKKPEDTAYLLFFGYQQLDRIVDLVLPNAADLATLEDTALDDAVAGLPVTAQLTDGHPLEVALFGRMVADVPNLNVDAATQVAHALSTHAVELEFDYYTAVDDIKAADDTADKGAGMLGSVEFNSATLYRYATLAVHRLAANLGGDTDATTYGARLFVDAFARSMPTGHQNSFAHRTLPHLVVLTARTDQPVNLVAAYEKPVRGGSNGIVDESAALLADEFSRTNTTWGTTTALTAATYTVSDTVADKLQTAFGASITFPQLLEHTEQAVTTWHTTGAPR